MDSRSGGWFVVLAGAFAVATVGVITAVSAVSGAPHLSAGQAVVWWTAYALYVVAFAIDTGLTGHLGGALRSSHLVPVQALAGVIAVLAVPDLGWTGVLAVVTVVSVAYTWATPVALVAAVTQTAVIALAAGLADVPPREVIAGAAAYGAFQLFALLVVASERQAVRARTELTIAHAELRAANAVIGASTRAAERLRISRELHDVMGHQLTALSLELEIATHDHDQQHVERARSIVSSLLADVRDVVGEMRRSGESLDRLLSPMLTGLPGLDVDLVVDERRPLGDAETIAVARCVQEAVTNTLRHARARHVEISVCADEHTITVHTRDDGIGAAGFTPGLGLSGMCERFEALGGSVTFDPAPGRGFALHAELPATP